MIDVASATSRSLLRQQEQMEATTRSEITAETTKVGTTNVDTTTVVDDGVPTEFICPLTLEIMIDPVVTKYGNSFERSSLINWLTKGHGNCPLTRRPLRLSDVVTDHRLRFRIKTWKNQNNNYGGQQSVDDETNYDDSRQMSTPPRSVQDIMGIISLDFDDNTERSDDDPVVILELGDPRVIRRLERNQQHRVSVMGSDRLTSTNRHSRPRSSRRRASGSTSSVPVASTTTSSSLSRTISTGFLRSVFGQRKISVPSSATAAR
jgi:U-box domain